MTLTKISLAEAEVDSLKNDTITDLQNLLNEFLNEDDVLRSSGRKRTQSFFNLRHIWGYGCFCNFGPNWRKAQGKPVNNIDRLCKNVYECYSVYF